MRSNQSPVKYLSMKAPVPAEAVREFGLVPGQQVEARVLMFEAPQAISVANIALRSENGHSFVQVREGGRFVEREVTLGARGTVRSQVLEGLAAGDEVLLVPAAAEPAADAAGEEA